MAWYKDAQGQPQWVPDGPTVTPINGGDPTYPYKGAQAGATLDNTHANTARANVETQVATATAPAVVKQKGADADKSQVEANSASRLNGLPPEVFAKALSQWNAATQLDRIITDMRDKFAKGPGATHGLAGIEDFLPTPANQAFDISGTQARGIVRNALGLTGGEANTAAEMQMNLGGYIPKASNFDSTNADVFTNLEALRDNARRQAVQTLGGVPDETGNVKPLAKGQNPFDQTYFSAGDPLRAADYGATTKRGDIPPAMQREYDQFLSKWNGNPDDYVAFRTDLDRRYGYGTDSAQQDEYRKWAVGAGAAVQHGGTVPTTIPGPTVPMSAADQLRNNAVNNPIGASVVGAADNLGMGVLSLLAGDKMDALNRNHSTAMMVGGIGGAIAGTEGIGALAKGALSKLAPSLLNRGAIMKALGTGALDTAYGGLTGTNQGIDPATALMVSGIGSGAGQAAGKIAGGVIGGVTESPAAQRLAQAGIPLTVGQRLGGAAKRIEDGMTSIPGVGDMVIRRRLEGLDAFNRAAYDQAAAPIGGTVGMSGPEGLARLDALKSQAYRDALDPATIDATNPQFVQDMGRARAAAQNIPNVNGAQDAALAGLDSRISGAIDPNTGTISGRNFQEAYRGLSRTARERANGDYGYEIGGAMRQGQDALSTALEDQNPGAYGAFLKANAANRALNVLADASNAAKNQDQRLFTPAQLNTADVNSAKRLTSKVDAAVGNRPFFDLANLGQDVLPSKVPDSGTGYRRALQALVGAGMLGGGTGAGYLSGNTEAGSLSALGALALLAGGGTKVGQKAINAALTVRPDKLVNAGRLIGNKSAWTGAAALPIVLQNSR